MNDPMTDSVVAGDDPELRAFLAEAEAAKNEMAVLRDELSRLQASTSDVGLRPGAETTVMEAALARLLGLAHRLRGRLSSMDCRAPDVQAHRRRQVSADRRYRAAVAGRREPTVEQLELLVTVLDAYAAMREALRRPSSSGAAKEAVERGFLELQRLFCDMTELVLEATQDAGLDDDIHRLIAASEAAASEARGRLQSEAEARRRRRRRRVCVAGAVTALVLVTLALAVVVAMARRGRGGKLVAAYCRRSSAAA